MTEIEVLSRIADSLESINLTLGIGLKAFIIFAGVNTGIHIVK